MNQEEDYEDKLLHTMKKRIITSYRWEKDVIIPLAKELKISPNELEEILMKRLDMASLEALHPRFESSQMRCVKERIHADLRLCWIQDVMNILTEEEADDIKNRIAYKIIKEKEDYDKAIEEGRQELLEYLKR